MNPDQIKVFPDVDSVVAYSAARIAKIIGATLEVNKRFTLNFSGGFTPRPVYEMFALHYASELPWERIHLFWGDERCVDPSDARSNYAMIKQLLIDPLTIPESNIHRIMGELEPETAAQQYENYLRETFAGETETFDLTLLGIGTDGHMASLFPGDPSVEETNRWVMPATAPDQLQRITLTAAPLLASTNIMFIITGKNKAPALQQILQGEYNPMRYPAQLIAQSDHQHTVWIVDSEAAAQVSWKK